VALLVGESMSHAILFDTLLYASKLKKAGFTEEQAEIQAEALAEIVDNNLATKNDIKELEVALKHDTELIRKDTKCLEVSLKYDIKELELVFKHDTELIRKDVSELEVNLRHDIKEMEVGLKNDIELLRKDTKEMEVGLKNDIELLRN